ncbi:hypothetical protein DSCA_18590 [Desulfosarcina alkanivorans]|uniref:Uncharacterized protein n=1 Tax=Desulfosarcina alkanivorans TaxID=571177 RepID=A0A5K7YJ78_9BACT|nr:hypothetical protein [Desulfosarcina alkanivorans]BBO67929.1 hypothetical protein DSCA_18590 [Desulfosarcina alkanivorans]
MLFAAKHRKDRNFKLREDEVTSCILGPLSYMPPEDVWALFRVWLPFKVEMWPTETPTGADLSFWPNLENEGRTEPDLVVRFTNNAKPMLTVLFEIKWNSAISGKQELVNQWEALSDDEKKTAFHIYLVKDTGRGNRELTQSLTDSPKKLWRERLVCVGWRSLIEILLYNRPKFGTAMNLWADGVIAFLQRRGQTTFTGFEWLADEIVSIAPEKELFWNPLPWFSMGNKVSPPTVDPIFWRTNSND